jgi:hypothetical protein
MSQIDDLDYGDLSTQIDSTSTFPIGYSITLIKSGKRGANALGEAIRSFLETDGMPLTWHGALEDPFIIPVGPDRPVGLILGKKIGSSRWDLSYRSESDGASTDIPATIKARIVFKPSIDIPEDTKRITIKPGKKPYEMTSTLKFFFKKDSLSVEPDGSMTRSNIDGDDVYVMLNSAGSDRTRRYMEGGMQWSHMFPVDQLAQIKLGDDTEWQDGATIFVKMSIEVPEEDIRVAHWRTSIEAQSAQMEE